tara:strand:- start:223 stop:597 length:375 start_codon:yes stop_codon:yes gene_type:complete
MYFCENDDNMLYIKINENEGLKYYCKLCLSEYKLDELNKKDKCVYKQNYNTGSYSHVTHINDNIFNDPTLPRINNMECINKNCETHTKGKDKEILYIKYSKKDLKFVYCCTVCKTKWSSSETKN